MNCSKISLTHLLEFSSIQSLSHVWLFANPWIAAHQASLSITNSQSLLKLMSIKSVMPSHPLLSPSPPTFNLSKHQGLFQLLSSSNQWPKYWSFSFCVSPSNEYSGLISFRMDWLDLPAVQGTPRSLLCRGPAPADPGYSKQGRRRRLI